MEDWEVWEVVPRQECYRVTGRAPLGGKWVDLNKGDAREPQVRSRYVAKEIAFRRSDDFWAATPSARGPPDPYRQGSQRPCGAQGRAQALGH